MKKNENIDDLLPLVNTDLRTRYEVTNGLTQTLKWANAEYEIAQKASDDMWRKKGVLEKFYTPAWVIFVFSGFYAVTDNFPSYVPAVAISLFLLFFIWCEIIIPIQDKKHYNTCAKLRPILLDFRQTVEALNPMGWTGKVNEYTSDSIWGTLLLLAVQVLEAKSDFFAECKSKNPRMGHTQVIIEWEQDCRKRFNDMFEATTKFGLNFSKERIYQAAQNEIDQHIAWKQ